MPNRPLLRTGEVENKYAKRWAESEPGSNGLCPEPRWCPWQCSWRQGPWPRRPGDGRRAAAAARRLRCPAHPAPDRADHTNISKPTRSTYLAPVTAQAGRKPGTITGTLRCKEWCAWAAEVQVHVNFWPATIKASARKNEQAFSGQAIEQGHMHLAHPLPHFRPGLIAALPLQVVGLLQALAVALAALQSRPSGCFLQTASAGIDRHSAFRDAPMHRSPCRMRRCWSSVSPFYQVPGFGE